MIDSFSGQYRWLSNFHLVSIYFEGIKYKSVEHAFQAAKTKSTPQRRWVQDALSPGEAKYRGRKVTLRPNWEAERVQVMHDIVTKKFKHATLRARLINTGHKQLVEGNYWGDTFWGVCNGKGENNLGIILMNIRFNIILNT